MTACIRRIEEDQVEAVLARFTEWSYRSRRDGCIVVLIHCSECDRQFEELLVDAKARVAARRVDFLCLACDSAADVPGLRVVVGWKRGTS